MIKKIWSLIDKLASLPDDFMDIHDDEENAIMNSWMDL
jgi:hypothetical protein